MGNQASISSQGFVPRTPPDNSVGAGLFGSAGAGGQQQPQQSQQSMPYGGVGAGQFDGSASSGYQAPQQPYQSQPSQYAGSDQFMERNGVMYQPSQPNQFGGQSQGYRVVQPNQYGGQQQPYQSQQTQPSSNGNQPFSSFQYNQNSQQPYQSQQTQPYGGGGFQALQQGRPMYQPNQFGGQQGQFGGNQGMGQFGGMGGKGGPQQSYGTRPQAPPQYGGMNSQQYGMPAQGGQRPQGDLRFGGANPPIENYSSNGHYIQSAEERAKSDAPYLNRNAPPPDPQNYFNYQWNPNAQGGARWVQGSEVGMGTHYVQGTDGIGSYVPNSPSTQPQMGKPDLSIGGGAQPYLTPQDQVPQAGKPDLSIGVGAQPYLTPQDRLNNPYRDERPPRKVSVPYGGAQPYLTPQDRLNNPYRRE